MSEFALIWFETGQYWAVLFANGKKLDGCFPSMGHARNAAMEYAELGESDFEVTEDTGTFYRFELESSE